MSWKYEECDETAEKWGLCRWHWALYMHPSNQNNLKGDDETGTVGV